MSTKAKFCSAVIILKNMILMNNFSFVFQSVYLFHDTNVNNIRFGRTDTPMEEVIAAAEKACCHEFISANIDPENENNLMQALHRLTKEKTKIMIAHRLKTVKQADKILVLDHGRIVQRGKHAELLQQDGLYRQLINARSEAVKWKISK